MATPPRPSLTIFKQSCILDNLTLVECIDKQLLYSIIQSDFLKTRWDLSVYSQVYASQLYVNEKSQLEKYFSNYNDNINGVPVKYVRPKHGFGRVFPQHSLGLTSISKKIRNELIKKNYVDYDLKNAQPSILQNICNEHNIPCPKLDEYCINRETHLQKIVDESNGRITRELAKKLMLRLFFNGTWYGFLKDNDLTDIREPDCVSAFIAELNTICGVVKHHNKALFDTVRKSKQAKGSTSNIDGAFLSLFIQEQETRIVSTVIEWMLKKVVSNNTLTYEYDGIKLSEKDVNDYLVISNLTCFKTILNEKTYELTGFRCEWELKDIVGFEDRVILLIPLPMSRDDLKQQKNQEDKLLKDTQRQEKATLREIQIKREQLLKVEMKELNDKNKQQKKIDDYQKELTVIKNLNEDDKNPYCCGVINNDEEGATLIIEKIKDKLIYCNGEVFMKNGMVWSCDNEAVDKMLMDYILHCDLQKSPAVGVFIPYSKNVKGARDLKVATLAILQRVNTDNKLYDKFHTTTKGRLCFKDGVLDMRQTPFRFVPIVDNELPEDFGEYMTTIMIDRNFSDYFISQGNQNIMDKIRDDIIKPLFGDNWERVLNYWSRAMYGHYEDKTWMLYTGNRNCGKGVVNDLNETAFGRYHSNINSDNFITKMNRHSECEKELQFALPAQFSRWAFCQEQPDVVDKNVRINSSRIKSLISGGDKQHAKLNYAVKSVQFIFAPTLVMLCNDHLGFTQDDVLETCNEISSVTQFITQLEYDAKVKRGDKMMERFRIQDPNIKAMCKTDDFSNAWVMLLLNYYIPNKGVVISDRCGDDVDSGIGNDENDLEYFISNNFTIDKKSISFMSSSDIHDEFVRLKNGKVSTTKIGISLSKVFGLKSTRQGSPRVRGYVGISLLEPITPMI